MSGYFSDQATIDRCKTNDGGVDNGKYNRMTQVAPYKNPKDNSITYKPHLDNFRIDPDRLEEVYGTRDFNAAMAKCMANNQYGEGGGNQGFNPYLAEMINNKCLVHDKGKSYSDPSTSKLPSES